MGARRRERDIEQMERELRNALQMHAEQIINNFRDKMNQEAEQMCRDVRAEVQTYRRGTEDLNEGSRGSALLTTVNFYSISNHGSAFSINTAYVVSDYINYKVQKEGFNWQNSPTRNTQNNEVRAAIRALCNEFEKRYGERFGEMCESMAKIGIDSEKYMTVLERLVEGGLNWGRVVAIFAFSGAVAVQCLKDKKRCKVDFVRVWTCTFMHTNVDKWIEENNGWQGLVDFYEQRKPSNEEQKNWQMLLVVGAIYMSGKSSSFK